MKIIYTSIIVFGVFLLSTSTILSQNTKTDSLKIELQNHKEQDTIRVELLIDLANTYVRSDFDKAIAYLDESETLAKALDYKNGIARSIHYRGFAVSFKSNFTEGDQYFIKASELYESINNKKETARIYSDLGVFYYKKGDYNSTILYRKKAVDLKEKIEGENIANDLFYIGWTNVKKGSFDEGIKYYNKALIVSEQSSDFKKIANCLNGIGDVYSHQGNYPLSLEYLNKALVVARKDNNARNISDALVSIGNVYIRLQNYDKAIKFHESALIETKKVNNLNLATISHNLGESYKYKKNYEKALNYFKVALEKFKESNNKADEAITLNKIGEIYFEQKEYNLARQYFEKGKSINITIDNQRGLCESYLGLAKIDFHDKNYNLALKNVLNSEKTASKLELIDAQRDAQELLSKIYFNANDYKKAYISQKQFKILNDSLFNKENIEKITQLEYEYKYKQALDSASIRELKLTKTVQSTSQDLETSQRNYLWAIIGVLLLSILLGAIIFYQKLKNVKSKTENIVMEQKLLRSQMTPHFIFNSLSVLQGMILNKEEKKAVHYLSKFSKLLRITLENSRDKTVSLDKELTAIQDYLTLQNLENEAYNHTVLVDENINIPTFEVPPMLIQPFVENSIEHAFINQKENRKIDIRLTYSNKKLICTISDNGVGINFENGNKRKDKKSLATTITSERLKILSKDLNMKGSAMVEDRQIYGEQGTIVTLEIPHKTI